MIGRDKAAAAVAAAGTAGSFSVWLAAEYGSRAYGSHRRGSDHDVRGVFVRSAADYLSLAPGPDSVRVVEGDVDLNLVDMRRFLADVVRNSPVALSLLVTRPAVVVDEAVRSRVLALHEAYRDPDLIAYRLDSLASESLAATLRAGGAAAVKRLVHPLRLVAARQAVLDSGIMPAPGDVDLGRSAGLAAEIEAARDEAASSRPDLAARVAAEVGERVAGAGPRPRADRSEGLRDAGAVLVFALRRLGLDDLDVRPPAPRSGCAP